MSVKERLILMTCCGMFLRREVKARWGDADCSPEDIRRVAEIGKECTRVMRLLTEECFGKDENPFDASGN